MGHFSGYLLLLLFTAAMGVVDLTVIHDTRRVIGFGSFGFGPRGEAEIAVDHCIVATGETSLSSDKAPIGFVLDRVDSTQAARNERATGQRDAAKQICFLSDNETAPARPQDRKVFLIPNVAQASRKWHVAVSDGLYSLIFFNCHHLELGRRVSVSFSVRVTMSNANPDGTYNYLSIGQQELPLVYTLAAVIFSLLTAYWLYRAMWGVHHSNRLHILFTVLLVLKTLCLALDAMKFHQFSQTGHGSIWDVYFYVFSALKGTMLFTVLLLLGSGWSVVKAYLSDYDRRILAVLLPCQIVINLCLAIVDETSEASVWWWRWMDLLQVLDVVCCCCVLLPIVWSIRSLREVSADDDKAVRVLWRVKQFRTVYLVVVAYIYSTRIVAVVVQNILSYELQWMANVLREGIALAFYAFVVGVMLSGVGQFGATPLPDDERRQEVAQ